MAIAQLPSIQLLPGKKVYFASDFHLGMPSAAVSLQREKLICEWLKFAATDAQHIFLLGDIFDAWLEYKHVVPKGFTRLLGTLAQLRDAGIAITVFTGNHDLWMYGYFEQEFDIKVLHHEVRLDINDTKFLLAHGDGLGPGDRSYKMLKGFLNNRITKWAYRWLHPDLGIPMAQWFSQRGAYKKSEEEVFHGEKEYLIQYCHGILEQQQVAHFIFGHRHYMLQHQLSNTSTYTNLGDWLQYNSYAQFDGQALLLKTYK
ncbi:MAG: hypothetical protein RL660_2745 [Bacteroidota bacterium]|jgi:UDP-2,3-diacylglucosamine hydrolase